MSEELLHPLLLLFEDDIMSQKLEPRSSLLRELEDSLMERVSAPIVSRRPSLACPLSDNFVSTEVEIKVEAHASVAEVVRLLKSEVDFEVGILEVSTVEVFLISSAS